MKRMVILVAVVGLVLAACSPSETIAENIIESQEGVENVEIDEEDGTVEIEIEGEDGDASATIGGGDVPDGFPIGVPDGGEVTSVFTSGDGANLSINYPAGEYENIVGWYENWVSSSGLEVFNKLEVSNPPTTSWALRDGEEDLNISVSDVETNVIVVLFATNG